MNNNNLLFSPRFGAPRANIARCFFSREGCFFFTDTGRVRGRAVYEYGQFSSFQICFCGLDPGNLKFETVRTNKQHICF